MEVLKQLNSPGLPEVVKTWEVSVFSRVISTNGFPSMDVMLSMKFATVKLSCSNIAIMNRNNASLIGPCLNFLGILESSLPLP